MSLNFNNTQFRYKINHNWTGPDAVDVEGVPLTRDWKIFGRKQFCLDMKVRTLLNPLGIVDMEEFDPTTNKIFHSSSPQTKMNKPKNYRKEDLDIMNRDELSVVASYYNIDPSRKINDFLIKTILRKQKEYLEAEKTLKNSQNK
jgi:hypothetical protein